MPRVSVIMPVYNAAPYLRASLESILNQDYEDIELIAVNDGSSDASGEILNSYKDPRIRVIHQSNAGVANALNVALGHARGEYIARQDADDVSLPNRVGESVRFLDQNPAYGLVGAWAEVIGADNSPKGFLRHPGSNGLLQYYLLWNCPFVSSTVMFRKFLADELGGFRTDPTHFDDYDMWSRIAGKSKVANLQVELLRYREIETGLSHTTNNAWERLFNQRRDNLRSHFPQLASHIRDGLAHSGSRMTKLTSLSELRSTYAMMRDYFLPIMENNEERRILASDLRKRLRTLTIFSVGRNSLLYLPFRLMDRIIYSIFLR